MTLKVLIVDDSSFYRRYIRKIIEYDDALAVIDEASNGRDAIDKTVALRPDVVIMDVEMPVVDGIEAVKQIMAKMPTPILMFSSLTHDGARATLDSLEAGALDFLPKCIEDTTSPISNTSKLLRSKVHAISHRRVFMRRAIQEREQSQRRPAPLSSNKFFRSSSLISGHGDNSSDTAVTSIIRSGKHYKCLAIGASTGGPMALQKILTQIPVTFPYPIIVIQHMPATFTNAFAKRLDSSCMISVKEASNGDVLQKGWAYIAPGNTQMVVEGSANHAVLHITDASLDEKLIYKPSVDLAFASLAKVFGGDVLGIILTGMGADGRDGARVLKGKGAKIWAQDEQSCVVYGMPQAVASTHIAESSITLDSMASCIKAEMGII